MITLEEYVDDATRRGRPSGARVFVPDGGPLSESAIHEAESKLRVEIPQSYRAFLRRYGPGEWCDEFIVGPADLYPFDDCGLVTGYLALVVNVRGVGDYVAFNPADAAADGDRPMYYCSHDPFGYGEVATTFLGWLQFRYEAERDGVDPYAAVDGRLIPCVPPKPSRLRRKLNEWFG